MKSLDSTVVLGPGSWGTALAVQFARNNKDVILWGRNAKHIQDIQSQHRNDRYLPGINLPNTIQVSQQLHESVRRANDVIIAVPSHGFRTLLEDMVNDVENVKCIAWATKGFDPGSGRLLHEIVQEVLGDKITAVISGPTFAMEVAKGLPTAVTVASEQEACAQRLAKKLHSKAFRVYTSDDIIGVEVGGASKNVLAIAAGIADGLGFGANTRAALITRGMAEMMRLGESLGGRRDTFMGLTGLGDLLLTCTDNQSRNRRLGLALGEGKTLEQALSGIDQVVEGVQTTREVHELAAKNQVAMPISEQVYNVIYGNKSPRQAVQDLLAREITSE